MLIIHHNDPDGRTSAAIAYRSIKPELRSGVRFAEMDYNMPTPLDQIGKDEEVIIVDFSFKPPEMKKVLEKTKKVTWVDHHETAASYDYGSELKGLRRFVPKGPAACELTWQYFFPDKPIPIAVQFIGDYDSWRLEKTPETFEFFEGLKSLDHSPGNPIWDKLLDDKNFDTAGKKILDTGKDVIKYRDEYCSQMLKAYGYETEIDGFKALALNVYRFGMQTFGKRMDDYDVLICYIHDGDNFTVSIYSTKVDVSKIATNHGGGGHKGAAGFVCKVLPFKRKGAATIEGVMTVPVKLVESLLNDVLNQRFALSLIDDRERSQLQDQIDADIRECREALTRLQVYEAYKTD